MGGNHAWCRAVHCGLSCRTIPPGGISDKENLSLAQSPRPEEIWPGKWRWRGSEMNADGLFRPGDDRRFSLERVEFIAEMRQIFPVGEHGQGNLRFFTI